MPSFTKLVTIAVAATLILTVAISAASARDLSISEQGFRLVWSELTLEASGIAIACPLTLEGSFERASMTKRAGTVGRITGATSGTCERGRLTVLGETLPWAMNYVSFEGTLPTITGATFNLIGASYQIENTITCLFRTETNQPFRGIARVSSGEISELRADETARIETSGGFFCSLGGPAHYAGTANMTVAGGSAHPRLTLIGESESTPARLTPSPIEFGRVEPEELARRTVTITAGTSAITVNRISVANGNYFAITDPNRCVGARLSARGTCAFKVLFAAPGEAERSLSDTVRVETTERTLEDTARGST